MTTLQPVWFVGGDEGTWKVERLQQVVGDTLPTFTRLMQHEGPPPAATLAACRFTLQGTVGHVRYVERSEKVALASVTPPLGRPEATQAAFIPIRKSASWWELAQDERRHILEQSSKHISLGMSYLPAIARRLYQSRELGQGFDFLTWFEFAPEYSERFEQLVHALRSTEEWSYVEREVDVRLARLQPSET